LLAVGGVCQRQACAKGLGQTGSGLIRADTWETWKADHESLAVYLESCRIAYVRRSRRTVPDFSRPAGRQFCDSMGDSEESGCVKCRWHDLRHGSLARSSLAERLTKLSRNCLDGCHQKMIEKYSHVRAEAKRWAVAVFNVVDSNLESPQNPPQSAAVKNQKIM